MKNPYREPQVEEGLHNIILQNRCGNRCTLLAHDDRLELEFVYKPNAFRRKDFAARNFSNRDNYTTFLQDCCLPDWNAATCTAFHYDAFHTHIDLATEHGARNQLHWVDIADENVFALAAPAPLLLRFRMPAAAQLPDGLLRCTWQERGEDIVSFIAFPGIQENRYRQLDDGSHVLQLYQNDVVLIGAEENSAQIARLLRVVGHLPLDALLARNEAVLRPDLITGSQHLHDPEWQRVMDCNRRVVWSGIDAGGACFGAINRIYHLIWVRDGSMTCCHNALAGDPEPLRVWAPFLMANPSLERDGSGGVRKRFGQMVGTRWSKAEDDGLFYAAWTLFTHFQVTGDDRLLQGDGLAVLIDCVEEQLERCWDEQRGLMVSDTLGEDPLPSSPTYGYDVVNGKPLSHRRHHGKEAGVAPVHAAATLYHQVNTYNVLRMITLLLAQRPDLDDGCGERYARLADRIQDSLHKEFVDEQGRIYSLHVQYEDGSEEWRPWGMGCDHWEHGWAVSQGPFYPVPSLQLESARLALATWSDDKPYGYCPWNVLARSVFEHGLPSADYAALLADEISDALAVSQRYPMAGALTEYHKAVDSWRGLPFSAGSFRNSCAAQLLQAQAQGLAVRGGLQLDAIDHFRYRLSRIQVRAQGTQDGVGSYQLNGETIRGSLLLPEDRLLPGDNELVIHRDVPAAPCRIHGGDMRLLQYREQEDTCSCQLQSAAPMQVRIQGLDRGQVRIVDADGNAIEARREDLPGTDLSILHLPPGQHRLELQA